MEDFEAMPKPKLLLKSFGFETRHDKSLINLINICFERALIVVAG